MTAQMDFPWFLSNVYDRFTSDTLGHGLVSSLMQWNGLQIGLMGLSVGIDLILGGHDHEYGVREVNGVAIIKSGSEFRYLSKVDVSRKAGGGFQCTVHKVPVEKCLIEDPAIKIDCGPVQ
ncbi:hypothetical protein SKAU_G00015750 [Synaphobranchus kaupii]|uniref:Uncharacterized protein n=1 Tax=Synaphobranchus kaupii TaxID=118154 RepID=A0A9Q1GB65_SYNKA|nr:hypothetical protein SKAU_G00015750 [Synaphobranchus kaupii]